jgi:hypothetical protein
MSTAKPMPAADEHAPVSILNRTGRGIRTMIVCSCEWFPKKAPEAGSTRANAHMAHRRAQGLPRFDYSREVFGEGPWAGWTWDEWYVLYGGKDIDPYTGVRRVLPLAGSPSAQPPVPAPH